MTGKRGGDVTEVNMNIAGMGTFLISYRIFIFLQENTFITPLLMASLHCIIDGIIVTS